MFRKIMWCYVFVLTLLDISLNTKLSAQGKSHGVTVQEALVEGITFQEWGKEAVGEGSRGGRAVAADALQLSPPELRFGRAALAAAHVLTVTLTNTANTTMHLASVAGTTPDFHASFFESKTLAPQANTSFSVVYLGRREGPVYAHLYIHTSLGVHKYPVSAVGVASEWGVWPLVGVRVPLNATLEPLLTMHNPTHETIQVSEVYSSGSWLGLRLPSGGESAPKHAWSLPPHSTRALVRLRLHPHAMHHQQQEQQQNNQPLTAYIRIKANMTGGGLVVGVEAISTQPGEYLSPLQIRLSTRGSRDPPGVVELEAGNSLDSGIQLDGQIWGSRCGGEPLAPPPPEQTNGQSERAPLNGQLDRSTFNGQPERSVLNGFPGVRADGVHLSLEQTALDPHQPLKRVGRLSVDYARLWAAAGEEKEAWCAGWVRVGRAAVPYSLKLVAGTFALHPPSLHFVTANLEEALKPREVHARNEFATPVYVARIRLPPEVEDHFDCEWSTPTLIEGGARAFIGRVTLRRPHADLTLNLNITIVTNLTEYTLPLMVYSGKLTFEWDWPKWSADHLDLGAVGTSSTRRVSLRLVNTGPQPLCAREVGAQLAGAQLALAACAHMRPPTRACTCVGPGASAQATLTVVAPAREGPLQGTVVVATEHAATAASVTLHAHKGRVHALPLHLYRAAPYTWSEAPLVLESSMALRMRVVDVSQPHPDLALSYLAGEEDASREVSAGRRSAGRVAYAPERLCAPHCYAGLDTLSSDGAAWARRAQALDEAALAADAALLADRYALYRRQQHHTNISLYVHTTQVVQIPVTGTVEWWWPQVAETAVADAGLAGVGSSVRLVVRLRNPSPAHPMLLQPVISPHKHTLASETGAAAEAPSCGDKCMHSKDAFKLGEWRAMRGAATAWGDPLTANASAHALGLLLLEPKAELELTLTFTPKEAAALNAHLYLRNNLTIIESVALRGRGAYPSFELGGRRPGAGAPLIFEVSDCGGEGSATVVRTVVARNTGSVPVRLREWRVAGEPCAGRGFSLQPCASLALAPNESRPLRLAFTADFTLAQVPARLHLRADSHRAEFALLGAAPARLLAGCHARAPPPPFDPPLRTAATLLALATLALVFAAAALDAERELRRARGTRPATPARPPLDLRAVAAAPSPTVPPAPASRPKPAPKKRARAAPRRTPLPLDPHAEKLAFDRWRGEVLQVQEDEDDRSSEDADGDTGPVPPDARPLIRPITPEVNEEHHQTNDGYEADADVDAEERPPVSGDEDAISTGSESASSLTPPDDRDEEPDEADEADDTDEPETISPRVQAHEMEHRDEVRVVSTPALDDAVLASPEEHPRAPKLRREAETPKRGERVRTGEGGEGGTPSRGRSTVLKHHARKDKAVKRRPSRPPPSPPRSSPPRLNDAKAPGVVRWGASWSSVVAARSTPVPPEQSITPPVSAENISAPPTLAPIGSDVRRRTEVEPRVAPIADNSLFFFNGEAHVPPRVENEFAWRAPPADERPAFITPVPHEFLGGEDGSPVGGAFRPMSGVWGGWGSWGVMRPPPGFGTPAQPVRAYDPFRSLASIWAPGGLDWRPDTPHHSHHPQDEDNNNNTH